MDLIHKIITIGKYKKFNVSIYANPDDTSNQMREIRLQIKDKHPIQKVFK